MLYLVFAFVSAVGSLLVGIIGTGSSLVVLPSLILIFSLIFSDYDPLRLAVGTTMATIAVGAFAGAVAQYRKGHVDFSLVRLLFFPYAIGGFLGPWISRLLATELLQIYIAVLLAFVALNMLIMRRTVPSMSRDFQAHRVEIGLVLTGVGVLCSLSGIASGILAIPYLMRFSLPMHVIVGTSTAGAAIYATFGSLGYMISANLNSTDIAPKSIGYVYLPAFLVMASVAIFFTPLGVHLARFIDEKTLRKTFAIFLFTAAIVIANR